MKKLIFIFICLLSYCVVLAQPANTHSISKPLSSTTESSFRFYSNASTRSSHIGIIFDIEVPGQLMVYLSGETVTGGYLFKFPSGKPSTNKYYANTLSSFEEKLDTDGQKSMHYMVYASTNDKGVIEVLLNFIPEKLEEPSKPEDIKEQNHIRILTFTNEDGGNMMEEIKYFDGLGRPKQIIQKGVTPSKADLVSLQEYDAFGRESNTWLPINITTNNYGKYIDPSTIKSTIVSSAIYNNDTKPFSTPIYETSPLNRIVGQFGAGDDWHNKGKSVNTGFLTNKGKLGNSLSIADSLVCGYIIDAGSLAYSYRRNYDVGELYVTRIKDEDNNVSYEFKNKLGQVVLSRQINYDERQKVLQMLDTYYVYDDYGNLTAVFPPEASDLIYKDNAQINSNSYVRLNLAYLYRYDHRNRCTWKKLPGCEPIYYVYDTADQLIFSQDGEQRKKGEWAFSIPDAFGRTVLTGVCKNILTVGNQIEAVVKATLPTLIVTNTTMGYTVSGIALTTPLTITSANYYDNYNFLGYNDIPNSNDTKYIAETGFGTQYTNAKGMLTGSVVAQMNGSTTKLYSVMYYDNRGRLIQTKSNNHLTGGFEKEYIAYNFTGQPTKKLHVHSATAKTTLTELYTYSYDHAGRLLDTKHKLNAGAETLIATNTYDELGRLKTNKKGGNASLNTTYAYNIRSWTTSIMSNHLHFNLDYTHGGNIKSQSWRQSNKTRRYDFTYDNLSRLTASNYTSENTLEKYNTSYSYDKHGNMMTIQRGGLVEGTTFNTVDNLALSYVGNQLNNVHDTGTKVNLSSSADFKDYSVDATKTKKEYTYNANGAMTQDLNKGISTIQYNSLNLPTMMDIKSPVGEARNEYTYSAGGAKLKVVQKWNPGFNTNPIIGSAINVSYLTTSLTTDYVGNNIYENGNLKRILIDGGYIEGGKYHYCFIDHLGNNRAVAEASGTIIQQMQYYPFGMAFAENVGMEKQPYKYNGKELDTKHGLNMYDYSARYLDNAVPRFTSVDPLAEKYYSWSPYVYVMNNPMKYVDPDGKIVRVANSPKVAAESLARVVATSRGNSMYQQLISSENLYTLNHTWAGSGSTFDDSDASNNKITYGTAWSLPWNPSYPNEIILGHESMHAFDHSIGTFSDSNTIGFDLRSSLEQRAVSLENYLRDVYSMTPSRNEYGAYGKKQGDLGFSQMPANGEKVSNFTSLGNNENETAFGFSFQKNDNTRYISVSYDNDKNVTYRFYDTEDEYKKATKGW